MNLIKYLHALLLSLLPIVEPRYAILYSMYEGIDPNTSIVLSLTSVLILSIILSILMSIIDKIFIIFSNSKFGIFRYVHSIYVRYIENVRKRVRKYVYRYGIPGLIIFIMVPLPLTGMWTGAIAGYVLGLKRRTLFLVLLTGGILSVLVTYVCYIFGISIASSITVY